MLKIGETSTKILGLAWWKWVSIVLVLFSLTAGMILDVPKLPILHETIRNLYYHVTQWFSMMILLYVSLVASIFHLGGTPKLDWKKTAYYVGAAIVGALIVFILLMNSLGAGLLGFTIFVGITLLIIYLGRGRYDLIASETINVALFQGVLGILTGMLWAKNTWGAYWTGDAKLNGVAMGMLVYLAYTVLRGSMDEEQKRARVSAVYNIFAFVMFMVFIMVLPRMTDSLHPGNGGNPGFGGYDLNSNMRVVFYPAIIGWTLLGVWLINIRVRMKSIEENRLTKSHQ